MEKTKVCRKCGRELTIDHFKKTRWGGYVSVCTECATRVLRENKNKEKENLRKEYAQMKLKDFTPRELMQELSRRGYKGKLTYVRVEEIDINNF